MNLAATLKTGLDSGVSSPTLVPEEARKPQEFVQPSSGPHLDIFTMSLEVGGDTSIVDAAVGFICSSKLCLKPL